MGVPLGVFSRFPMMGVVTERALVDVAITGKGDGTYQDGATREKDDVKVTTNRGHSVWVSEKDVYARKPNPEEKDPA